MAEQLLQLAQVSPASEKMRREAVAKRVWGRAFGKLEPARARRVPHGE